MLTNWMSLVDGRPSTTAPAANEHINFLLKNTAFQLNGTQPDLTVYLYKLTKTKADPPLLDWVNLVRKGASGWIRLPTSAAKATTSTGAPVTASSTKSVSMMTEAPMDDSSKTLSQLLYWIGKGYSEVKDGIDYESLVPYLRCQGHDLAKMKTKTELLARMSIVEAELEKNAKNEDMLEEYEELERQLHFFTSDIPYSIERLWFPLDEDVNATFEDKVMLQNDDQHKIIACRTSGYLYLICASTESSSRSLDEVSVASE